MEQKIAIIICNFNKKDYVLQCIDSVFAAICQNATVYVVDNASTDGSAEAIRAQFGDHVNLLVNSENLGGSGGFNTGIREALKGEYQYLYLLDNDIILDPNALTELVSYLDSQPRTAIAGSAIYSMDHPDELQELGAEIDWENYYIKPRGKGRIDSGKPAKTVECDYVPACSMLVRADVVREVGLMDEGNFIYWDDIEWGYRIKQAGYRVGALHASKVWHKMGVAARSNTFGTYYFWRNRLNFFLKYLSDEDVPRFVDKIFAELFQALYSCNFNHKYHSARTILFAVEDALNHIRGKAPKGRIIDADPVLRKFEDLLCDKTEVLIVEFENIKTIRDVINRVRQIQPEMIVSIVAGYHDAVVLMEQFPGIKVLPWNEEIISNSPFVLRVCRHI
ncbi:MAG TPA: glycosyltransferase family 2 protein, partial [Bacillota bacterium]|nr:glycosyltransferase family 2 protein [Bacillota bacterium]